MGENGAGKSSLIKILAGIYRLDEGKILIDGVSRHISSTHDSRSLGLAFIHQELHVIPHLSVAENILLGKYQRGFLGMVSLRKIVEVAKNIPNGLPLNVDFNIPAERLSAIEQWKMIINRAIAQKARVIFMDEPTASLTFEEVKELFASIETLKAQGTAIVYVTHRIAEVFEIADRVTVFRDGKNVGTKSINNINQQSLIEMMVGQELKNLFPQKEPHGKEVSLATNNLQGGNIIKKITFKLHKGEILGLTGLVGSGRTELAKVIFGIDKRVSGEIFVDGKKVDIRSPGDAIRHGVSLVPEERAKQGIIPMMTVKENISLGALNKLLIVPKSGILSSSKEKVFVSDAAHNTSFKKEWLNVVVKFLSGGNQQKVVLARWICAGSKIFIFDEPTRGIDVGAKSAIYKIIRDLAMNGASVILISSDLLEIMGLTHRIIIMNNGLIKQELKTEETDLESVYSLCLQGNGRQQAELN